MTLPRSTLLAPVLVLALGVAGQAAPQAEATVELVVAAGRPLRVALEERVRVRRVGQAVRGILAEPVYAYDRVVIPAGTLVLGRVARLEKMPRGTGTRAVLSGDFTPPRRVVLDFDTLVLGDGSHLPVRTEVRSATDRLALRLRDAPPRDSIVAHATEEVAQRAREAKETLSAIKRPGRLQRLKYWLIGSLPLHPRYLRPGTVYTAVLLEPLAFGAAPPLELAPAGTLPPADSVLRARLLTPLDSAKTPRGSAVKAVVTEPLFSEDHRLILPEGTVLTGEVTFAMAARRFHRNGQLRFLFESVQPPDESAESLKGSLYSVQVGGNERLALDEEGGATITNSKRRFAAPALAGFALAFTLHRRWDYDTDGLGPEAQYGSLESRGLGGFFGFGLAGAALSQVSRPFAVGFGAFGVARSVFVSVAGKGRNVSFPADTVIDVQLAAPPEAPK